jgi:hypothetical protein
MAGLAAIAARSVVPLISPAAAATQGANEAGLPGSAALPASAAAGSAAQAPARMACPSFYCDFRNTGYTNQCFNSQGEQTNWGNFGCRNVDESFRNESAFAVRLWFSPNFGGAHVCIEPQHGMANMANYTFNSGSGRSGFGSTLNNNVASSSLDVPGACTNPIGVHL